MGVKMALKLQKSQNHCTEQEPKSEIVSLIKGGGRPGIPGGIIRYL